MGVGAPQRAQRTLAAAFLTTEHLYLFLLRRSRGGFCSLLLLLTGLVGSGRDGGGLFPLTAARLRLCGTAAASLSAACSSSFGYLRGVPSPSGASRRQRSASEQRERRKNRLCIHQFSFPLLSVSFHIGTLESLCDAHGVQAESISAPPPSPPTNHRRWVLPRRSCPTSLHRRRDVRDNDRCGYCSFMLTPHSSTIPPHTVICVVSRAMVVL